MTTLRVAQHRTIPVEIGSVARVKLLELLGAGGFGSVWKVIDESTGTLYTLKIVQDIDPGSVDARRVRLEAEVDIPSPYVVRVVGLREWDPGTFLILFEYFQGASLDRLIETDALDAAAKRTVFLKTLAGVADAHRHNVIHRDLKPANILMGDDLDVRVIDFGLSKIKDKGTLTATGAWLGTIPYLAPEVLQEGAQIADARVDIYALGHILYELAMGHHFWQRMGWSRLEHLGAYLRQIPPPAELIDAGSFTCDFFPNARDVLRRMVKLDPSQRYRSVGEVLADLGGQPQPTTGGGTAAAGPVVRLEHPLLVVQSGTNRGARTVLWLADGESRVMGRVDIAGGDETISRRHFAVSRRGSRYLIQDAGSKNGTLVNGATLPPHAPPRALAHGDHVKVGDTFLCFVQARAAESV